MESFQESFRSPQTGQCLCCLERRWQHHCLGGCYWRCQGHGRKDVSIPGNVGSLVYLIGSELPHEVLGGKTCPARGVFGSLGPWVLEDKKSQGGHTWIQANPLHTDGMSWMRWLQLLEVAGCAKTYESVSKSLLPEMKCEMSAIMRNSLSRSFKAKAFRTPIFAWHNVLICFAVFTYIHVYR